MLTKSKFFSRAQLDQQWVRRCKQEENLLVDSFGTDADVSKERQRLYKLFMQKKALSMNTDMKPVSVTADSFKENVSQKSRPLQVD